MSSEPSDLLPILNDEAQRGFDVAMRGYDRGQVDRYFAQVEDELRSALAEREAATGRSADLAAQLAGAQAQIESLRRQLRHATETVNADNVDAHVHQMLETAKSDAARIRRDAESAAEQIRRGASDLEARARSTAQTEAERIIAEATQRHAEADETFRRRIADAEQHRLAVEAQLAEMLAQTRSDEARLTAEAAGLRDRLDAEAAAERARLDAAAHAARELADEDFEITLRARRTAENKAIEQERAEAQAAAEDMVAAAKAHAEKLIAEAEQQVRRLNAIRDQSRIEMGRLRDRLSAAIEGTDANPPTLGDDAG